MHSYAVMFLPTSSIPPSGVIRTGGFRCSLSLERPFLRVWFCCLGAEAARDSCFFAAGGSCFLAGCCFDGPGRRPRLSGGWGCWSVSGLSCAGWAAFSFSGSAGFSFAFLVLGSAFCSAFAAASFICAPVFLRGGAFRSTAARFSSSSSPISSCCSVSFPLIFLSSVTKLPPYDFEKVRFSVNFNRACLKTEKHLAIPPVQRRRACRFASGGGFEFKQPLDCSVQKGTGRSASEAGRFQFSDNLSCNELQYKTPPIPIRFLSKANLAG